jgi:hypothetical protein
MGGAKIDAGDHPLGHDDSCQRERSYQREVAVGKEKFLLELNHF